MALKVQLSICRGVSFFEQPMVMAQKSRRCDLRVNEYNGPSSFRQTLTSRRACRAGSELAIQSDRPKYRR
jgi:hypothetical protein